MPHNTNGTDVGVDPVLLEQFDAAIAEGCRRMIRSLATQPHAHWWRQLDHHNAPGRMIGRMMICAHQAGVTTAADLAAVGNAIVQFARGLTRDGESPCLRTLSVREQRADAVLDVRQAELRGDETPDELSRMETAALEHRAALDDLLVGIARAKRDQVGAQRFRRAMRETARARLATSGGR